MGADRKTSLCALVHFALSSPATSRASFERVGAYEPVVLFTTRLSSNILIYLPCMLSESSTTATIRLGSLMQKRKASPSPPPYSLTLLST